MKCRPASRLNEAVEVGEGAAARSATEADEGVSWRGRIGASTRQCAGEGPRSSGDREVARSSGLTALSLGDDLLGRSCQLADDEEGGRRERSALVLADDAAEPGLALRREPLEPNLHKRVARVSVEVAQGEGERRRRTLNRTK